MKEEALDRTVYIQQLARVGLFSWLSTKKPNTYQLLYIYSIPPDDGLQMKGKRKVTLLQARLWPRGV